MLNLPNILTLSRIMAIPLLAWFLWWPGWEMGYLIAFALYCLMGITDYFDGYLARTSGTVSKLGIFLDPIADKALLVSVYLMLGHQGYVEAWLVIMVVFRDLVILGGAILFQTVTQSLTMQPLTISKVNTFVQFFFVVIVLWVEAYGLDGGAAIRVIGYIVAVTTLWSGTAYVITWSHRAAVMEDTGNPEETE